MLQSKLFGKTLREGPKDEVSRNADLLTRAGFVAKEMAGGYSFLPLGLRVLWNIAAIIRKTLNEELNAQEVLMPALHPIENYQKTGRDTIDILFHTELVSGGHLVLGQSHEEIVVPLAQRFISSYRDLPLGLYQIQTKFRNELRAKSGLLRGREFLMKDLYSFHATEEDFDAYYEKAKTVYAHIFQRLGLGDITFLTFASGGTFSKYSHEFQALTDAGEDIVYLCESCHVAVNDEIIQEQAACPKCNAPREKLVEKKAIEVGNIFPLKGKFSDAFGLSYTDEKGAARSITMGCYGIGLSRVMGAIVEVHHDEKGMMWPEAVAPFAVHLLELSGNTANLEVKKASEKLYKEFLEKGIAVLYDDRGDKTPGQKFADADLIGIPWRVVISEKTIAGKKVEVKKRSEKDAVFMTEEQLLEKISGLTR